IAANEPTTPMTPHAMSSPGPRSNTRHSVVPASSPRAGLRAGRRVGAMTLDPGVRDLFAGANFVHLATLLPDGSPHSVAIWADVHDDDHVVFFTSPTSRKARNLARDPRVAMSLVDRDDPYRTGLLRGRAVGTIEGDEGRAIVDR